MHFFCYAYHITCYCYGIHSRKWNARYASGESFNKLICTILLTVHVDDCSTGIIEYYAIKVRAPFASEVTGSILSENALNFTQTQCSTQVKRVNTMRKVVSFLRALRFPPTRKLIGWVSINTTDREVKYQLL